MFLTLRASESDPSPVEAKSLDSEVHWIRLRVSIGLVCEISLVDPTTPKAASKCQA